MTRREMLAATVSAPALWSASSFAHPGSMRGAFRDATSGAASGQGSGAAGNAKVLRNMGGAPTAFSIRARNNKGSFDIVDHCHRLGLGAVQTRLPSTDAAAVKAFRQKLDSYGMRAVLGAPLPKDTSDVAAFDTAVAACKEAGAVALHAAMTQRRYEEFDTAAAFKADFESCKKSVQLAEPVLRKHKIKLAIENHKGWRSPEQAAWLKSVSSEWVGATLDFGNNISLCEDPMDTMKALEPYTIFCHIKDMGVQAYEDGFLLSEVPFGEGVVDLGGIVKTLQQRDPSIIFALEMITRDPLKIPVFTDKYWATFDDTYSPLPGRDLARTLLLVKKHPPAKPLPHISGLAPDAQVALEDELNQRCVDYCRQHLPALS
jgi:3-oxoisoapionate decarboxylase